MTERRTEGSFKQDTHFSYRIVKAIAIIGGYGDESKELNLISYGNRKPKYDLRSWTMDDNGQPKMLRGITLSKEEAQALRDALNRELEQEGA